MSHLRTRPWNFYRNMICMSGQERGYILKPTNCWGPSFLMLFFSEHGRVSQSVGDDRCLYAKELKLLRGFSLGKMRSLHTLKAESHLKNRPRDFYRNRICLTCKGRHYTLKATKTLGTLTFRTIFRRVGAERSPSVRDDRRLSQRS